MPNKHVGLLAALCILLTPTCCFASDGMDAAAYPGGAAFRAGAMLFALAVVLIIFLLGLKELLETGVWSRNAIQAIAGISWVVWIYHQELDFYPMQFLCDFVIGPSIVGVFAGSIVKNLARIAKQEAGLKQVGWVLILTMMTVAFAADFFRASAHYDFRYRIAMMIVLGLSGGLYYHYGEWLSSRSTDKPDEEENEHSSDPAATGIT